MSLWGKLVAGSRGVSRLRDGGGAHIRLGRLARNGPRALVSGIGRLAFGWRPALPWISYDATRAIADRLGPESRVLEFGSGTSTAWFAARAGEVVSIEDDPAWHGAVAAMLARRGLENVRLRLAPDAASYATLSPGEAGGGFDLVLIDGSGRDRCAAVALAMLRPGGTIYLDNADRGKGGRGAGETPRARRLLLAFAEARGAKVEWFTDFAPTQLFVQTGLLITFPRG